MPCCNPRRAFRPGGRGAQGASRVRAPARSAVFKKRVIPIAAAQAIALFEHTKRRGARQPSIGGPSPRPSPEDGRGGRISSRRGIGVGDGDRGERRRRGPCARGCRAATAASRTGAGMRTVQAALRAATRAALSSTRARTALRASAAWTIASKAACWRGAGLAHQQVIAARLDRADGQLLDRIPVRDRLHAEVVGNQHAAKAELPAQHVGRDPARQRRRPIGIERRIQHVRGHERLQPGGRRRRERRQLHLAQPIGVVRDDRQLQVRVGPACRRDRDSACRSRPGPRPAARARTPAPARATASGAVPNARLPITGLAGLVCTSSTGAKFQPTPTAASSSPSARPTAAVRATSPAVPTDSIGGQTVAGARRRCTSPPSWSMETRSGRSPGAASRSVRRPAPPLGPASRCSGRNSMTPPISEAATRARSSAPASVPSNPTDRSCPARRARAVIRLRGRRLGATREGALGRSTHRSRGGGRAPPGRARRGRFGTLPGFRDWRSQSSGVLLRFQVSCAPAQPSFLRK